MQVQITGDGLQSVDVHKLTGTRFVKRTWSGRGRQGEVLGIRPGAKVRDRYALVVQFDSGHICLVWRNDIKILED